ncbi:50S ribosomal protein L17 [soil metagenome]
MYKQIAGFKLSRNSNSRKALFRSLIAALILNGKIETTKVKTKAIQGDIDKLFTLVVKDSLANRRLALSKLGNDTVSTDKLFGELKQLTKKRTSGFTRIINLPNRKGDNAPMARMEWTDILEEKKEKKEVKTK